MKTFEWIMLVLSILCILFISGLKISFKPFKISVDDWMYGIGWVVIAFGIGMIIINKERKSHLKGYEKGLKDGQEIMINLIQEKVKKLEEAKKDVIL